MTPLMLALTWIVNWIRKNPTATILSAIIVILILTFLFNSYCGGKPKVQLNEKEQQEVRDAIETRERGKMEAKYIELEVKNANIDANVAGNKAETVNVIANARTEVKKMTDEDLRQFLEDQVNK